MSRSLKLNRRNFVKAGMAMSAAGSAILSPSMSMAAAEIKKTQAPGFFRFNVGSFEVTILTDGMNRTPLRFSASNIPEDELKEFLRAHHLPTDTRKSHLNVCLINTGTEVVLVDTGSGDNFTETAGKLTASLESAGYAVEDIDTVVITHGHPDHIWGIIDDFEEEPRFPNAKYFIDTAEWDYWTAPDLDSKLPEGFKFFATGASRNLLPVAEMTTRIKSGAQITAGITTMPAPGHTLGHMAVLVESEGETLAVVGDAITHPLISLQHPEWQPQMDMDKTLAVQTRKTLLDMASNDRLLVSSYHMPFPGVGRIVNNAGGYNWVPVTWEWDL